jgi:flagellar assembly protein FliH
VAKHVFRPTEIVNISRKIFIEPPSSKTVEPEVPQALPSDEEYEGPSIEDLQAEVEEFRENWEKEKQEMIEAAKNEAERIVKEAEGVAFEEVKKKSNQAKKVQQEAETEAQRKVEEAKARAEEIEEKAKEKVAQIEKEARDKGYIEGHEGGYKSGADEVGRLVERLQLVISKAIEKRAAIIDDSETQLINMVLLIARKVIKVISERVNLADLELATEHTRDFMRRVENVKSITVMEDSSVDKGGCIIDADFGQIDARISSQLNEIEEKILEMTPIQTKGGLGLPGIGQE